MAKKLTTCKMCGAEIAPGAKICPHCGAKNKKPFYTKWWFYTILVVVLIAIAGGAGKSDSPGQASGTPAASPVVSPAEVDTPDTTEPSEAVSYTPCDVTELFDALSANALKAEQTYLDQYVELYGYLSTIDSDGKYISISADPEDWDYLLQSIHCTITSPSQLEQIIEMNTGDQITVRGKITDIGEILGYMLDIDSIN